MESPFPGKIAGGHLKAGDSMDWIHMNGVPVGQPPSQGVMMFTCGGAGNYPVDANPATGLVHLGRRRR